MFERIQVGRLSDYAATQLVSLIASGKLVTGQQLPPETELEKELGVSRTALREALRILEALGYVKSKRGRGTYVTGQPDRTAQLMERWRQWVQTFRDDLFHLYELREMVEIWVAAKAAQRATEDDRAALRACLRGMELAVEEANAAEVVSRDREFHELLGRAARNPLLHHLLVSLHEALGQHRMIFLSMESRMHRSLQEHWPILEAVERGDAQEAARLMELHVQGAREMLEELASP